MGRFNHGAVAVDLESGDVFLTEDRHEGLIYKYAPKIKVKLSYGGKLYSLKIKNEPSFDTRNRKSRKVRVGQEMDIVWTEMDEVNSPKDDLCFRGLSKELPVLLAGRACGIPMDPFILPAQMEEKNSMAKFGKF